LPACLLACLPSFLFLSHGQLCRCRQCSTADIYNLPLHTVRFGVPALTTSIKAS
jgi:hypothetical protein